MSRSKETCKLCEKPLVAAAFASSDRTIFRCQNQACTAPAKWHFACVDDNIRRFGAIDLACGCGRVTYAQGHVNVFLQPIAWMLQVYPYIANRVLYAIAIAAVTFLILAIGIVTRAFVESFPELTPSASMFMNQSTANEIVMMRIPIQLAILQHQMTQDENPALAVATVVVTWIYGLVVLRVMLSCVSVCRRRTASQTIKHITVQCA